MCLLLWTAAEHGVRAHLLAPLPILLLALNSFK